MTRASVASRSGSGPDIRAVLLPLVIGHQARIAAERAATVRNVRRAEAARRAADAVAGALVELERLVLPDRARWAAERSGADPLPVPGTITPAERAWVLAWHLLAAAVRLHGRASQAGSPKFSERESAKAAVFARDALRELDPLLARARRSELRGALAPSALDAQLRLFEPLLAAPHGSANGDPRPVDDADHRFSKASRGDRQDDVHRTPHGGGLRPDT